MTFTITNPIGGVWLLGRSGQRPVEGTAVYEYSKHWDCETHGPWNPTTMTAQPCVHIQAVKEWEEAK